MMKTARNQWGQPVDVAREPIDHASKVCILTELYAHPGAKVVKWKGGQLYFQRGRFQISCEHMCEAKRR